jgi:hypothetical protein
VSPRHPFARRPSVSFADLARTKILRTPPTVPDYWDHALVPQHTSDGRPVERGPSFGTVQEMLALVGAGFGTYPVAAQATAYYARPDVVYVPIHDAPPYRWRFVWLSATETAGLRPSTGSPPPWSQPAGTEHVESPRDVVRPAARPPPR